MRRGRDEEMRRGRDEGRVVGGKGKCWKRHKNGFRDGWVGRNKGEIGERNGQRRDGKDEDDMYRINCSTKEYGI